MPTPSIPATVWILGFVSLLMDVSSEMIATLLPLYLVGGLGASAVVVGFVEGLSVAVATATKFFSGVVADWTRQNKPLAILGYGLSALSRLIFPMAVSVDLVVLAKAVDRLGKGIRGTPRDALIANVTPPEIRGASFGLRKSLDTVGGFLGPIVAILLMLVLAGNIVAVFWLAAIPAFLAVGLLAFAVHEPADAKAGKYPAFRLSDAVRLNRAVWAAIGLASLLTVARFSEAFILLKSLEAGFSPAWVPMSMVVMHAVYGLAAYPVGRLSDRIGRMGLLSGSLVFLASAHLVLAFGETVPIYTLGLVLWGLHMGFSQGLLGAMIADATPDHLKGAAFGTFNLATGVMVLGGNIAAGWMWQTYGSHVPFIAGAVLAVVAMLCIGLKKIGTCFGRTAP